MDDAKPTVPQIKVCGLTVPDEAAACAALGADAIGLVFFPPSPRHVTLDQAARITAALPARVRAAGVFVDAEREFLAEAIAGCGLHVVQLHGRETAELAAWLRERFQVTVVKALFVTKVPPLTAAAQYVVAAYLVECGQGPLPGGNAIAWDWGAAADFARRHPTILAGGLDADNVGRAIAAALPEAVDASSGLEAAPGRKDLKKVERFVAAVRGTAKLYRERPKPLTAIF
ncbi:MAG: phosphoribosylanthranilate isomerase [Desulfatitalea sp.]|nr:phosphoribosylanthranilate isomerase [Desulfatitalea sp.]